MARDYHSIPGKSLNESFSPISLNVVQASSVDVERAFSQGRILLSHIRNRLSAESTRSLLCLGAWYKGGIVRSADIAAAAKLPELEKANPMIIEID